MRRGAIPWIELAGSPAGSSHFSVRGAYHYHEKRSPSFPHPAPANGILKGMAVTIEDAPATSAQLDDLDRRLLNAVQEDFPLSPRPFADLVARLDTTEGDIIARVQRLKDAHIIRQISAIFDSRMLGYHGSLVAMKTAPEDEAAAAEIINRHPGVSHNYRRNHPYNLWFTLTLPPGMDLHEEIETLAKKANAINTWPLPTIKLHKIGVTMDMTGEKDRGEREAEGAKKRARTSDLSLTPADVSLIRTLQQDLPVVSEPFAGFADSLGITVDELLAGAQRFLDEGKMRRFAAVLHHREAGYAYNAMAVWIVPEEDRPSIGRIMASFKAVSHCYERPTYPDWPYSLFTMIHGQNEADCVAMAGQIKEATGLDDFTLLYSTKEYKKVRVQYFEEDYARYLDGEGRVRRAGDAAPVVR